VGRIPLGGYGARLITAGIKPGDYPRGGSTHLRIWAAERWANAAGASSLAGATRVNNYARALGVKVKRGVDLHSLPPVTGLLTLGKHAAIEPEVDLSGYWLDGDILHVGAIDVKEGARGGAAPGPGPPPPPSPLVLTSLFRGHLLDRVADQIVGANRGEVMYIPGYRRLCYRHI